MDKCDLTNGGTDPTGVLRLMLALQHKTCNIRTLRLAGNQLTAEIVAKMADGLRTSVCLRSIDLSGNRLGSEGAKALIEGGAFSGSLVEVDVSNNDTPF